MALYGAGKREWYIIDWYSEHISIKNTYQSTAMLVSTHRISKGYMYGQEASAWPSEIPHMWSYSPYYHMTALQLHIFLHVVC